MGTESVQKLSLRGLESARGFLQRKVADRLETRYTPHIDIVVDDSVKRSLEIARLLRPEASHTEEADLDHEEVSDEPGEIPDSSSDLEQDETDS